MKYGLFQLIKEDKNRFGLPNLFTLTRFLFLPFIIYFLRLGTRSGDIYALILMFLSCVTDYLDGYFARELNQKSNFGRMLDPLADKVSVGLVMLVLTTQKGLPLWYALIVIGRDLFILFAGMFIISRNRVVLESNKMGKVTSTAFATVIITYTLNIPIVKNILMWISLFLVPLSIAIYMLTYKEEIPKHKSKLSEKQATIQNS